MQELRPTLTELGRTVTWSARSLSMYTEHLPTGTQDGGESIQSMVSPLQSHRQEVQLIQCDTC